MIAILFSTMMAFAQTTNGPLPDISGYYLIRGQYEISTQIRVEAVHGQTASGQKRLQDLRADGYTCVAGAQSAWSCQKFIHNEGKSPALDQFVLNKWQGQAFQIQPATSAEPTNDSGYLKEWTARQEVSHFNSSGEITKAWTSLDYDWVQGLWKIYAGPSRDPNSKYFLFDAGRLSMPEILDFQKGLVRDRYMIQVQMELVQK